MNVMSSIHLKDIQAALVWARAHNRIDTPAGKSLEDLASRLSLDQPWSASGGFSEEAMSLWLDWYDSTPDTPCIAICSTSQGDDWCKGCGRSFEEVIGWLGYSPIQKRATWQRITDEGSAWRFTSYKERARG